MITLPYINESCSLKHDISHGNVDLCLKSPLSIVFLTASKVINVL